MFLERYICGGAYMYVCIPIGGGGTVVIDVMYECG